MRRLLFLPILSLVVPRDVSVAVNVVVVKTGRTSVSFVAQGALEH